jgi:5'-3' exonuclease
MATSFKEMSALDPNTIMVVDALNLAFRWKHKGATVFAEDYIRTVESFRKSYKAEKVIIACDQGSSSYRKTIYPDYKLRRKEKYENQTDQEAAYFEAFFREFNKTIDTYNATAAFPVLRFDKVEADDIAAYVVNKYRKTHNIWLISTDKDWDLLVDNRVSRFSYITRKETTLDNWGDHHLGDPEDYISIKVLMGEEGESSDNITGVPGIGPKKAHALVKEYGSAYDIIASLPIQSRYKHIASLNEFGVENLIRNYKLMDLVTHCGEAIGPDNCKKIDEVLGKYIV